MDAVSILPESAQTLARTKICDCFATGQKQEFEHEIGDGLSVLARVVPIVKRGKVEQVLIVSTNITALKEAERTQRRAARRAQMLLDLLRHTFASENEVTTYAISQLTYITDSTVGFIGIVDRSEATLTATLWPAQAAPGNAVGDRPIRFDLEHGGPWAEAIRNRKSILSHHDDETNPLRRIDPTGCIRLTRFLAIPVIRDGRAVLLAGVGNKAEEYDEWDRAETAIFLEAVWEVIGRRRAETDRRELEEQLRVSQKMEAIGRLAGGISHDFNNLLTVISSCVEFALESTREGDPLREDLQQIRNASQRAAALTSQLLAFSRRQVLALKPLDLNQTITGMEKMLRRIIGEDIELHLVLDPDLGLVTADPSQIEQTLMNLTVNARDAMPSGGRLTLRTGNIVFSDARTVRRAGMQPGAYVMLAVTDTGCGMDEATRGRVFEPFFTLKGQKGSGLGLSTVYGIVKQSGGEVQVESELGSGATFTIYLPRTVQTATPEPGPVPRMRPAVGSETILVVEDEAAVRNLTVRMLSALGYSDDTVLPRDLLGPGTGFIAKPFTSVELARKVREVLDTPGRLA